MKTIEGWMAPALLAALLAAAPALASVTPESSNGVTYVSGGVGNDEQAAMQRLRPDYRLRMLFAVQGSGDYLATVPVTISHPDGDTLLETTAEGPFFFANLPAGTYRVTVSNDGRAISRTVTVPKTGAVEERFYWPAQR